MEHQTARFTYKDHGEPAYSRVSVGIVRGWMIEQRITAPAAEAMAADLIGEIGMIAALDRMSRQVEA